MIRQFNVILLGVWLYCGAAVVAAQEKVVVGHSARAALFIGPLLYRIECGFYCDEGWV